jgi:hypothetical protein
MGKVGTARPVAAGDGPRDKGKPKFSLVRGAAGSQAELCADANLSLLRVIERERGATGLELARLERLTPDQLEGLIRVRLEQHFEAIEQGGQP